MALAPTCREPYSVDSSIDSTFGIKQEKVMHIDDVIIHMRAG